MLKINQISLTFVFCLNKQKKLKVKNFLELYPQSSHQINAPKSSRDLGKMQKCYVTIALHDCTTKTCTRLPPYLAQ